MYEKTNDNGRHRLKNRVRGLRAVRSMRSEAQFGFDDLSKFEINVYCYPDPAFGHSDVQLEPGYGKIELRDDDRYDVEMYGMPIKTGCRYDELEIWLMEWGSDRRSEQERSENK